MRILTILSENNCHFVNLLRFENSYFFLSLRYIKGSYHNLLDVDHLSCKRLGNCLHFRRVKLLHIMMFDFIWSFLPPHPQTTPPNVLFFGVILDPIPTSPLKSDIINRRSLRVLLPAVKSRCLKLF